MRPWVALLVRSSLLHHLTGNEERAGPGQRGLRSNAALEMLEEEIRSDQFLSIIRANGDTPQERYEAFSNALIREIPTMEAPARYPLDGLTLNVFLTRRLSERDSYLEHRNRERRTL